MTVDTESKIVLEDTEPETDEELEEFKYEISSYPADYTLRVLYDKWSKDQLKIPDFQRAFVWTRKQASRLIESFLLGLPVPGVFLYKERKTQKLLVVDGQHRIGSIGYYYKGVFKDDRVFRLQGVDKRWNGKSYEELDEPARLQLDDSVLRATVIQQVNPDDHSSIYLIFERLNTGGTQLNPMEVRKAINAGPGYDLLASLNTLPEWRAILGRIAPDQRLKDVELVLRVLAMSRNWRSYSKPMKTFLTEYLESLSSDEGEAQRLQDIEFFERSCRIVRSKLGQ